MKTEHATSTLLLAAKGVSPLTFATRRESCAACHDSPHGEQFATRKDRGACDACHGVDTFVPASRFDHERDASFKLTGAHARVACADCHKPVRTPSRALLVTYRGLSEKCESCHAGRPSGRVG